MWQGGSHMLKKHPGIFSNAFSYHFYQVNAEQAAANGLWDDPCALKVHCWIPTVAMELFFHELGLAVLYSVSFGFRKISLR